MLNGNEKNSDYENVFKELGNRLSIQNLVSSYVYENVTLGNLMPKQKVPINDYIDQLGLHKFLFGLSNTENIFESFVIDETNHVIDHDLELFYKDFFYSKMNLIFAEAPKAKNNKSLYNTECSDEDEYMDNFIPFVCTYLKSIYKLFKSIVELKTTNDIDDLFFWSTEDTSVRGHSMMCKFLLSVILGRNRFGSRVDGWVKKIGDIPMTLGRIIRREGKHNYLSKSIDSDDFKIAVISLINCMTDCNNRILNAKIHNWISKECEKTIIYRL